ncbi:hypothetical protein [Rhodococcus pyridinivorans]|uniref:hypothetical protein n=1 Tax=Rhodococcus pyridinivorans TaxID=103816 RepID=UPI00207862D3|nr:hypothetical protein [Rhodococcus pyridinivorans]USI91702.1 hypothetical protein LLA01_07415 [Rhodococcus pyridinivorans]
MRKFFRTKGADYLDDPNVSSVGGGYKHVDGKPTDELAVQFTVNEKVSKPEALEALGASPLPESITVNGVKVPTDVIERSYEPAFDRAPEAATPPRNTRLDPIVPGVSVGHTSVSAENLDQLEVLDLDKFRVFHVPPAEIEQRARLRFPQAMRDADLQVAVETIAEPLDSVAAIHW